MISDVLYEAIEAIEEYLNWEEPALAYKRGTPIRERIEALVDEMKAIELILNTPPVSKPLLPVTTPEITPEMAESATCQINATPESFADYIAKQSEGLRLLLPSVPAPVWPGPYKTGRTEEPKQ